MKKYEINKETFAVVGKEDEKTRIIEKNEEYLIDSGAYQIMNAECCSAPRSARPHRRSPDPARSKRC